MGLMEKRLLRFVFVGLVVAFGIISLQFTGSAMASEPGSKQDPYQQYLHKVRELRKHQIIICHIPPGSPNNYPAAKFFEIAVDCQLRHFHFISEGGSGGGRVSRS